MASRADGRRALLLGGVALGSSAALGSACAGPGGSPGAAGGGSATFRNPVIPTDFPDPGLVQAGSQWFAYATGVPGQANIQAARSTDLVRWELLPDALPRRPAWQPLAMGLTWAPEVVPMDGRWLMFYVARDTVTGRQCISVATADAPAGPFQDDSTGPLVCQDQAGGSIDPAVLRDRDGRSYLFWKNDGNAVGQDTRIWVQELSADGRRLLGAAIDTGLRRRYTWQGRLVEAPAVLAVDGGYLLFYSANDYASASYAMGYATASVVTGPYEDRSPEPWVSSRGAAAGPGGQSVLQLPSGERWLAYHAWSPARVGYDAGGRRAMWLDRLDLVAGQPVLRGPTDGPQPVPRLS